MGKQPDPLLSDLITRLRADLETVTRQRDAILMQARIWSGEAKSQKATVDQVGAILGGVPDWGPIAAGVEKLRADLAASQAECERLRAKLLVVETKNGRRNEFRSDVHGGVAVGGDPDSTLDCFDASSLSDTLWRSDEVMSLNAELGLSIDQLVQLTHAIDAARAGKGE